jgi:hypothetical protein
VRGKNGTFVLEKKIHIVCLLQGSIPRVGLTVFNGVGGLMSERRGKE